VLQDVEKKLMLPDFQSVGTYSLYGSSYLFW
jgi:hypothetical protein